PPATTGRTPLGSPGLTDTSARSATRLASTSRPGSGRRCPRASLAALLASRLDLLQGTFEKIHLQDLLGQHQLESADLFPERRLSRIRWRCPTAVQRLQFLAPPIQQPSTDAECLCQLHDVLAVVQPFHGHLPKDPRKLTHAFLGHLPPPSCVKCANSPCLNLGGQSRRPVELQSDVRHGVQSRPPAEISLPQLSVPLSVSCSKSSLKSLTAHLDLSSPRAYAFHRFKNKPFLTALSHRAFPLL